MIYKGRRIHYSEIPYHKPIKLEKIFTQLGAEYHVTIFGYDNGAIKQLRGPHGIHIHEFAHYYLVHRDHVDPEIDPVGHIENDAPELIPLIIIGGIAIAAGLAAAFSKK